MFNEPNLDTPTHSLGLVCHREIHSHQRGKSNILNAINTLETSLPLCS